MNLKNCNFALMDFSSKLLENAVNEVSQLPGIGKRTAAKVGITFIKTTSFSNSPPIPGITSNAK